MKKSFLMLFIFAICFVLVSCGSNDTTTHSQGSLENSTVKDGVDGADGKDGLSAYDIFIKNNPDYIGDEEQWINDYVSGKFNKKAFGTVTFDFAYENKKESVQCEVSKLIDKPNDPNRNGFEFVGWFYDNKEFNYDAYLVTENITLVAKWINNNYTKGMCYSEADDGYYLSSVGSAFNADNIVIPDNYRGKPVIGILNNVFENIKINSLTIPLSIKYIGPNCFNDFSCNDIYYNGKENDWCDIYFSSKLSTPTYKSNNLYFNNDDGYYLPQTLVFTKSINSYAFWGVDSIKSIAFEEGVTKVGDYAFYQVDEMRVVFNKSITYIGANSFSMVHISNNVYLPADIKHIGASAFYNSYTLTGEALRKPYKVYFSKSITMRGKSTDYNKETVNTFKLATDYFYTLSYTSNQQNASYYEWNLV